MYKTDLDQQLLRKNIKPWGVSQQNSWRLYELNKHRPGYIKHGNYWDCFERHKVTLDRLVDWEIPQIQGMSSTFSLQPGMMTGSCHHTTAQRPTVDYTLNPKP